MKQKLKYIDIGLRAQGLCVPMKDLEKIVKTVELINFKGGKATMKDIVKL